ncbi:transposase [Butyrivibrio sp.]|uniref:transposase n=1 Tax=Butyrivibrio sp. TaxID=28121 RepID=UPI0025B94995|nr:transposase [Butyrivibrio sp.]MBQ9306273.1 transposase [Butyrivibrio sp.]
MSFVKNDCQQLSLFDSLGYLSKRKLGILEKSWAKPFSDYIFTKIDEMIFAPLYSQNSNSRPNAPINVIVGCLILKELNGLTDDELLEECECDFRYQYALHTTSYDNQPISDRSFSRFRERVYAYELLTGEDLIHTCITDLAEQIRKFMDISPVIKRMDSMMIESNIKRMSRLELIYTCVSNLVKTIYNAGAHELVNDFEEYLDPNNRNQVVYYKQDVPQKERLQKVIDDAAKLLPLCEDKYSETTDYQLLLRAITEQCKKDDNGKTVPKSKGDGMGSSVLQNPSDPDATYRVKAEKEHRGYIANIVEAVNANGSVVTDYSFDANTHSDQDFIKEHLEKQPIAEQHEAIIVDGAYNSEEVRALAEEKNISVLSTGLLGHKPKEIFGKFKMSQDNKTIIACPEGHDVSSTYYESRDQIRVSLPCGNCNGCPHQNECKPRLGKRVANLLISLKTIRAEKCKTELDPETRKMIGRIRNGVETVPSVIRNKYRVDTMPVRGKLRTKLFFGFKVAALDFQKLRLFLNGKEFCRGFALA